MIIKKELIKRDIAGDIILVPVGKSMLDSNGLFVLNELGAFIWDLLPEAENEADICQKILAEYDISEEEVAKDVAEFMQALKKMNIV